AAERLRSHEREIIFRSQEHETASHFVVSPDASNRKLEPGHVDKEISTVLLEFAKFVVGKSAVIMIRVLPAVINIDHFLRAQRHDRMQHHALDERATRRVKDNRN